MTAAPALVTGATDGIGEEIARQLVARGTPVIVHGRSAAKAEAAADRVGADRETKRATLVVTVPPDERPWNST